MIQNTRSFLNLLLDVLGEEEFEHLLDELSHDFSAGGHEEEEEDHGDEEEEEDDHHDEDDEEEEGDHHDGNVAINANKG